jgi:hypothetical protein
MKKLLVFIGLAALAYWFVKDRLGGDLEEFTFTEVSPNGVRSEPVTVSPSA